MSHAVQGQRARNHVFADTRKTIPGDEPKPGAPRDSGASRDRDDGRVECASIEHLQLYRMSYTGEPLPPSVCSLYLANLSAVWLVFQLEGHCICRPERQALLMSPGEAIVSSGLFPRILSISTQSRCLAMRVPQDILQRRGFASGLVRTTRLSAGQEICALGCEIGLSLFDQMSDIDDRIKRRLAQTMRNLIYLCIRATLPPAGSRSRLVSVITRTKALIQENLRDPELCIEQIARRLHCTKRYLHMAFAAEATTISDYIWAARLERCSLELLQPQPATRTITEIAFSWGFNSSSHFNHKFKERFGFAPSVLQRAAREGHPIEITRTQSPTIQSSFIGN